MRFAPKTFRIAHLLGWKHAGSEGSVCNIDSNGKVEEFRNTQEFLWHLGEINLLIATLFTTWNLMAIYSCRKICAFILDHITKYCSTDFFAGKRDEHSWVYIFFTKKKEFRESPPVLGKILSTFWPPKVSHLRTECTWEHSWEQKNKYDWSHYQQYFRNILSFFGDGKRKYIHNCCFLSGSTRLWLSQLFHSQALVETSNVIMMFFLFWRKDCRMDSLYSGCISQQWSNICGGKWNTCTLMVMCQKVRLVALNWAPHFSCQSVCGKKGWVLLVETRSAQA